MSESCTIERSNSSILKSSKPTNSIRCKFSSKSRIRFIRLNRPYSLRLTTTVDNNFSFGFSVRGGREYGTGFYVSHVYRNSEANVKGLHAGDQILSVNGFKIDDAIHKEFVQFVSSQDRLTLKVRCIGLLPIKEKPNDMLTWHDLISTRSSESHLSADITNNFLQRDKSNNNQWQDINIVLNIAPRTKLGLGICKGPEWKPGIYVHFTKDKSIARHVGLKPGDQILSVNNICFSNILFSEAVAVMKSANKLEMVVRTKIGQDLFPLESSGYNSSSSLTTEELTHISTLYKNPKTTLTTGHHKNKTIIQLSESGMSISMPQVLKVENPIKDNHKTTTKTIPAPPLPPLGLEKSSNTDIDHLTSRTTMTTITQYGTLTKNDKKMNCGEKENEVMKKSAVNDTTLTNAIAEELKKRQEKQLNTSKKSFCDNNGVYKIQSTPPPPPPPIQQQQQKQQQQQQLCLNNVEQREIDNNHIEFLTNRSTNEQHNALMDEFKRAHQRMFQKIEQRHSKII